MIPEAAVEAAEIAISELMGGSGPAYTYARAALEAAAPHMFADAWESGMAAAKLQAAGIKPARNPYRSQND